MNPERYLAIDEDGYVWFDGQRLEDPAFGGELIKNLRPGDRGRVVTSLRGQDAIVEAFDAPLVAHHVARISDDQGRIDLAYGVSAQFRFADLSVDEWDRFHGVSLAGVPFVLSRTAQYEFFDALEAFDDESITVAGLNIPVPPWLKSADPNEEFWGDLYRADRTGWDLGAEHPALAQTLPQLKLSRSRVLVLGSGRGHDAAYLARQGHRVTAVDFSDEALARARQLYGEVEGLDFVRADALALPDRYRGQFDLVFEHTCYCAIDPRRRSELVESWRRALHGQGFLLGLFFVNERRHGPPFGGSEWEVRQRLSPQFHSLFWTRWRHSVESRRGLELVVYAKLSGR